MEPDPDWQPDERERAGRRRRAPLVASVVALALLVVGGGAAAVYFVGRRASPDRTAGGATGTTGEPATTAGASNPAPEQSPANTPTPERSTDARFVTVGQCVRNAGGADGKPKLAITPCGPKTYEVLRRFDGATTGKQDATTKCSKVEGYTDWYFFNSELDTLDFVLCLKQR
ncbi:LppU/SCO3897 family protein [Micromonospora zhanjiangensis]|uniref:Uncharacterized protein n=1 Tax=Micromonospora zhanjiangensis TaxID=1522057 RepID=A0ABV8KKM9_9ACTN